MPTEITRTKKPVRQKMMVPDKKRDAELRAELSYQDAMVQDAMVQKFITPHMLLDIFDEPIVFIKAYVGITHSAVGALFLSYATYTTEKLPREAEGWFSKTIEEWQNETGLTRFEQQTARRILKEKEILIERRVGMPSTLWFKISKDALLDALLAQSDARWGA
jgi:beta-glucosidase/6-phospho-beta-glucosidase/beta-galactosidase